MKFRTVLAAAFAVAFGCAHANGQATLLPLGEQCFSGTTGVTGMVGALGTITGGSAYTAGTYGGVALTGGTGSGATANITVAGGAVTAVSILNPGVGYTVADVLSAAAANIGGTGTGFSVPVNSTSINSSLAGGTVGYYIPGTLSFKQTWQDSAETILNANPVSLNQNGCAIVYGAGQYRQILKDSLGNTVWDQLTSDYSATSSPYWAGLAGGTPNAITVTDAGFSATDGQAIQFIALNTNTGATTLNPSSFGAISLVKDTSAGPVALTGGEIIASNVITGVYDSTLGAFHIASSFNSTASECLNITSAPFNGSPNSSDNTGALTTALAALPAGGGCIFAPPGRYKFLSNVGFNFPAGAFSLKISGGAQGATTFYWPSGGGGLTLHYGSASHQAHISDLTLATQVANGGSALKLTNSVELGQLQQTSISHVTIQGDDWGSTATDYWNVGIDVQGVSNISFDTVLINGSGTLGGAGAGISLANNGSGFSIVYNIAKSSFFSLGNGIIYGAGIQGVTVDQCNFTNGTTGIEVPNGATGGAQLTVSNSQFNGKGNGIITLEAVSAVSVSNNLFYVDINSAAIALNKNAGFNILGNYIVAVAGSTTANNGIVIGAGSAGLPGTITGNVILNLNTGVLLQAASFDVNVQSNAYANNSVANTVDAGTANQIGMGSP